MDSTLREASEYATIVELLSGRCFGKTLKTAMYLPIGSLKLVASPIDKKSYEIHRDFITEPPETHLQEGLVSAGIEGCSVAFRHSFQHQI